MVDQVQPRRHNALPESIVQWIVEQLTANFDSLVGLCFGEFVRILARLLVDKIKFLQVIPNCHVRNSKFGLQIASA
jgi:hypothetical protein